MSFHGFTRETFGFLQNLAQNNNKPWFEAHRQAYEKHVLIPLKALVVNLSEFMLTIDPDFEVRPAVNKAISRIYRDTRFSKDKSPFRSNMWIVFKRPIKDWKDAPGYFFEIFPDWYRYGMGFYAASRESMDRFRQAIDEDPDGFLRIVSGFMGKNLFELRGDTYKRPIDETQPEAIQTWVQRKTFYLVHSSLIDNRLFRSKLLNDLIHDFGLLGPFYRFLWKIKSGGEA